MTNKTSWQETVGLFPIPVYVTKEDSNLIPEKEIKKIIQEGMQKNAGNSSSVNTYIFNENLKELKQFCEHHIKKYVEEILSPTEELDFYITQSWLNITEPGEGHHVHFHSNSIISGVFYLATVEEDNIIFEDPNDKIRDNIKIESKRFNVWNATKWIFPVRNNELILFPSWLKHGVDLNEKATTDRISISFNTFVKGTLGAWCKSTELTLK
jgi:uncharacterized protein (TIGR02466 family)